VSHGERIASALLACLLLGSAQAGSDRRAEVLARGADELPRAPESAWSDWDPDQRPLEEVRASYEEAARAYARGDLVAALVGAWDVLERAPDWPPALQLSGVIYFRLKRHGDCIEAFERFLARVPGEVKMTRALGHSLYTLGRHEEALAHYERVLAEAPDMVEAVRGAALCHHRLGEDEEALELLDRVLELEPDHQEGWLWKGQILWELGQSEPALAAAERARDLNVHDPASWHLVGQILLDLGREEDAAAAEARFHELGALASRIRSLEAVLLYEPEAGAARAELARLFATMGNGSRARAEIHELVSRAPDSLEWRRLALDLECTLGDLDAAKRAALELEARAGTDTTAWLALARFWRSVGDRARLVRAGELYLRHGGDPATLEGK
jgi:tetratricopeptide (TPR) repeat protein